MPDSGSQGDLGACPLPWTSLRAEECPKGCKTEDCKIWGCKTVLDSWCGADHVGGP